MDETDRSLSSGRDEAAVSALESLTDPVVAIDDNRTVTYANSAAIDEFNLPNPPRGQPVAAVLESHWETIEPEFEETTAGTARTVALEGEGDGEGDYNARVHRRSSGGTITFDHVGEPPASDSQVKDRAINEAPVGIAITDPSIDDNPLVYINDAFERVTGYTRDDVIGENCRFLQGEETDPEAVDTMRQAIEEKYATTVVLRNYRRDGTEFWNEVTLAPVRNDDGEVTHYVGFQNDVTARKRAEIALRERTAELERVLERVEGLVKDVTAVVAGSADRRSLETAVCERIADESTFDGAWIGEHNPATNALEVRASAVVSPETLSMGADSDHPSVRAASTREVCVGTVDRLVHAAFPLTHNDIDYGVVTVCAREKGAIDDREQAILTALARAVASGINARETSRILETDDVVAVEFDVTDERFAPIALAAQTGCTLEYNRSVHRLETETTSLFTARGASADELEAAGEALEGVEVRSVVERGGGGENGDGYEGEQTVVIIELTTEEPGLVEWLSARGAIARSIRVEDGHASVRIEMPQSSNVRAVVEALENRYAGTDIVSFRQRERADETQAEFAARLEADLTDRQLASLRRAYLGGYFEWPRPATGEELAQSMGVSRPTFHEHLRTAEAKLCRALFETE